MTDPKVMSDDEFLAAFLDCTMPPAGFDHYGHVRVAWLLLRSHSLDVAVDRTCDGIARLAGHLGVPGKYHRTISEALVRLMFHGGAASPELSWEGFIVANSPLMDDARSLLARHYSNEQLASSEARERFVAPDRMPLPT
ncbi:MAG: hypothetical protein CVU34_05460 [Betaproteobacteria bacterium HGW-Betaproteobacteria-7]|nr:MAG: hypothetical protein CVU34_05460 [Betaproteobacteria bacterium HGW-Betaproteobacteria-7]